MNHTEQLILFIKTQVVKDATIEINPDTELFSSKLLDSINILDLIGYVEKHTGKKLSDNELVMSNFSTPKMIVEVFFS